MMGGEAMEMVLHNPNDDLYINRPVLVHCSDYATGNKFQFSVAAACPIADVAGMLMRSVPAADASEAPATPQSKRFTLFLESEEESGTTELVAVAPLTALSALADMTEEAPNVYLTFSSEEHADSSYGCCLILCAACIAACACCAAESASRRDDQTAAKRRSANQRRSGARTQSRQPQPQRRTQRRRSSNPPQRQRPASAHPPPAQSQGPPPPQQRQPDAQHEPYPAGRPNAAACAVEDEVPLYKQMGLPSPKYDDVEDQQPTRAHQ